MRGRGRSAHLRRPARPGPARPAMARPDHPHPPARRHRALPSTERAPECHSPPARRSWARSPWPASCPKRRPPAVPPPDEVPPAAAILRRPPRPHRAFPLSRCGVPLRPPLALGGKGLQRPSPPGPAWGREGGPCSATSVQFRGLMCPWLQRTCGKISPNGYSKFPVTVLRALGLQVSCQP